MEFLRVEQVAEKLSVNKSWIYLKVRDKENPIPFIRVGKYLRFVWEEVEEWVLKGR